MTVTEPGPSLNSPLIKPSPANSPLANPADPRRQFPSPFATYDFTSIPHEQLLAMIEPADAEKVTALAGKLKSASTAINKLGEDLKGYLDGVAWEGKGGQSFRDWASRMSNATLRLGHYAENAGTWMDHAAATLTQVHSQMPKYSAASKATVDAYLKARPPNAQYIQKPLFDAPAVGSGPSQNQAYEAQRRLHDDHMRAAELMKKLAESYNASGVQLLKAERPNFPPAPGEVMPKDTRHYGGYEYLQPNGSDDSSQGQIRNGAGSAQSSGSAMVDSGASGNSAAASRPGAHEAGRMIPRLPDRASTEIDSTLPAPTIPTAPPRGVPGSLPGSGSADGIVPPPRLPAPSLPRPEPRPVVPEIGTRFPTPRPASPSGTGALGTRPVPPAPRASETGVVGGRPLPAPSGRPVEPTPRGTVIGTEPGRGMGRPTGSYGPGAAGSIGRTNPGAAASGAFTQGGTGLPRGGASGMAPVHGAPGAAPQRRRGSQRPEYLVEDEETWRRGERRVVPPVIE
ncbi:hypothetical protein ACH427_06620 [Streptomyces sp. NPDC020379]|uniref:hypothetical protein n=1 Tax=Streptomyces sp. NPDC020379 TaxID=3365071 RepID=UPI0037886F16